MSTITVKNGEAKTITFTVTRDSAILDLSTADLGFRVKADYDDTTSLIDKTTTDFDTSQASVGIVSVTLETTDLVSTNISSGTYKAELKMTITATTDVDISETIDFVVQKSVY